MKMNGEETVDAPREKVWQALNDPEVLRACIPGCESLESTGDSGFEAVVRAKVGPVSARFTGNVELTHIVPPESYTISGQGKGGVAGFASGGADVQLEQAPANKTILRYDVNAQVGGELAQIGSRLIDSTARKMATQFFANLAEALPGYQPAPKD